jgi:hypothetical protein
MALDIDLIAGDAVPAVTPTLPVQSGNDETTIALFQHGRSAGSRHAYEGDARALRADHRLRNGPAL